MCSITLFFLFMNTLFSYKKKKRAAALKKSHILTDIVLLPSGLLIKYARPKTVRDTLIHYQTGNNVESVDLNGGSIPYDVRFNGSIKAVEFQHPLLNLLEMQIR